MGASDSCVEKRKGVPGNSLGGRVETSQGAHSPDTNRGALGHSVHFLGEGKK